jgi:hypothetical protein
VRVMDIEDTSCKSDRRPQLPDHRSLHLRSWKSLRILQPLQVTQPGTFPSHGQVQRS